ncbi:MAG: DUF935 domain-containing protein [Pseudomonadota bacterium]
MTSNQLKSLPARLARNRAQRRAETAKPVRRPAYLKHEVAETKLGSIRSPWGDPSVVAGLTAPRLARTLRAAERGDTRAFLTLAEEMEEREPHYASVLATRKRAVSALDPVVIPASEDARDQEIAEAVRTHIVEQPIFSDLVSGLQDALGKGYALVETVWKPGSMAIPVAYKRRDQRHFKLDQDDGETLRLITDAAPLGEDLQPYKWTIHRHKQKEGLSIRGGLARLAAWSFMFKQFSIKDWAAFLETYGQPLRLGRYGPEATEEDRVALLRAVLGIGADAGAVIPKSMEMEFVQASSNSSSSDMFERYADWTDRQVSKAVLGQTMSTDEGGRGGRAQAEVHDGLRDEIKAADARALARSINEQTVRDFVNLNFGRQETYPLIEYQTEDDEDLDSFFDNLGKMVDRGLQVDQADVYARFGLTAPEKGAAVLVPFRSGAVAPSASTEADPPQDALNAVQRALNRSTVRPSELALDALMDEFNNDWAHVTAPIIDPVTALAEEAQSADVFLAGLDTLAERMDGEAFTEALANAMTQARVHGDLED